MRTLYVPCRACVCVCRAGMGVGVLTSTACLQPLPTSSLCVSHLSAPLSLSLHLSAFLCLSASAFVSLFRCASLCLPASPSTYLPSTPYQVVSCQTAAHSRGVFGVAVNAPVDLQESLRNKTQSLVDGNALAGVAMWSVDALWDIPTQQEKQQIWAAFV